MSESLRQSVHAQFLSDYIACQGCLKLIPKLVSTWINSGHKVCHIVCPYRVMFLYLSFSMNIIVHPRLKRSAVA
jgi:hypothetical protein